MLTRCPKNCQKVFKYLIKFDVSSLISVSQSPSLSRYKCFNFHLKGQCIPLILLPSHPPPKNCTRGNSRHYNSIVPRVEGVTFSCSCDVYDIYFVYFIFPKVSALCQCESKLIWKIEGSLFSSKA